MSLTTSHFLPYPRRDVWDWHTRPGAVVRLSPPFVPMQAIKQADNLADGLTRFSLPAGLKWDARHDLSGFHEGRQFSDVCVSAPLKALANWRHVHFFDDEGEGTRITDQVTTRLPGRAMHSMFAYRQHQLLGDLQAIERSHHYAGQQFRAADGSLAPVTFAVTGSGGTIGTALCAQLTTAGHRVIRLTRSVGSGSSDDVRLWDPNHPAPNLLDGVDVLIHLAGEPLLGRFNDDHKEAIYSSRVEPTRKLAQLVADSSTCNTMVVASAIGFYGHDRGDEVLSEDSATGEGFLAHVCRDWEAACQPARDAGKRVVNVRTGIVLSGRGGVLPVLRVLFSAGLGGKFGDGTAWFSWIAIDDLTDIYLRASLDPAVSGPINATGPNPVQNKDMVQALAKELKRPAVIPIPSLGPKLILGEQGAQELALANQRVVPEALLGLDHTFRYTTIEAALAHELGGEELFEEPK
ncbi:TIGR01777 family oxidoreductase [Corynebacterium aquilae]|uniref:Nucleoside-diphosphate sugar epimerase n=1 Tax=Corynebacterium aquilae DSM 44791 TaxID=1431546 RepID=A0A1L7CG57_9CORY|nr:TIGR01777 family oxidoreductase [Corynebacterium aquilae]APT84842.1 nucleoside-diphosphate sugar epimerase [Corynebacterium aquilae DSM 44791]